MTKNDIIESLCKTAVLTNEQLNKAIAHKGKQSIEYYLQCYSSVEEETDNKISMAKYCLYILCKLKF